MRIKKSNDTESIVEVIEPNIEVDVVEVAEEKAEEKVEDKKAEAIVETPARPVGRPKNGEGNVQIKMAVDHKCSIAMHRYIFKKGETYVVPENVKTILNKMGYLAPLD